MLGLSMYVSVRYWVGLGYRSSNFVIGLTNVSPGITAPTLWNYDVCGQYPGVVGDGATVYLQCTKCMEHRRYLIVQLPGLEVLNFCEIEVYVSSKAISTSSSVHCRGYIRSKENDY